MADSGSEKQPFDQRHLMFALLATMVLIVFNPWQQPPVDEAANADASPPGGQAAAGPDAENKLAADNGGDSNAAAGNKASGDDDSPEIEVQPAAPPQRATLGSLAEDGPFRMLATFTNTGAAVERIELASPDFRDLDDRSGYLGALGIEPAGGGARVTTVGPGTPAAEAGLQVGDIVTSIRGVKFRSSDGKLVDGEQPIEGPATLAAALAETKPKQEVTLSVLRSGQVQSLAVTLARRPLALLRPEAENILLHREEVPADFKPAPSYRVTLDRVDDLRPDSPEIVAANRALLEETWAIDSASSTEVTFRKRLPALSLELVKRFTLPKVPEDQRDNRAHRGYHLDLQVEVVNLDDATQTVSYTIEGPNGLPIEGWWYSNKIGRGWGRYGIRDIIVRYSGANPKQFACSEVVDDDVPPMGSGGSLAYIGVDAQYFAAALVPDKASLADVQFGLADTKLATPKLPEKDELVYNNPTYTVTTRGVEVPAGATAEASYTLFAGPKRRELLAAYYPAGDPNYSLEGFSYLGWFAPVARVMLGVLHFFYGIVGNYGLAIILLTVLVRSCMYPISRKQAQSMVMMQKLKPEIDRIAAKHKDDRQKQAAAQQELFRKHNYNPLGGCLPMFLQLPIFIGLYRALAVDVELRQAPLLSESIRWCSNLAAPDMLYDWSGWWWQSFNNGQGIFSLGPFFNILPIATVCLFLLQQKMFMPEATSEQAILQQKMMKYMMGFMGLMFFKVASGLCLYFIASSCWGMAERKLLPKPAPATGPPATEPKKSVVKKPPVNPDKTAAKRKKKGKKRK